MSLYVMVIIDYSGSENCDHYQILELRPVSSIKELFSGLGLHITFAYSIKALNHYCTHLTAI